MDKLYFEYGCFFKVSDTGMEPIEDMKEYNNPYYDLWKSIYDCPTYKNYGEKDWEIVLVENHFSKNLVSHFN